MTDPAPPGTPAPAGDPEPTRFAEPAEPAEPADLGATTSFEDQERAVGIDPDAPLPGERGLRIILFGAIAVFGIPALIGGGIAAGYPIVGIVLAIALGAICLLFARPRGG